MIYYTIFANFCQVKMGYGSEPFNCRFFGHFREVVASMKKHPSKNTRSYREEVLGGRPKLLEEWCRVIQFSNNLGPEARTCSGKVCYPE